MRFMALASSRFMASRSRFKRAARCAMVSSASSKASMTDDGTLMLYSGFARLLGFQNGTLVLCRSALCGAVW